MGIGRGLLAFGLCNLSGEWRLRAEKPECDFLFPAFQDRSSDAGKVNVFQADERAQEIFLGVLQEKMKEVRQIVVCIKESILENKDVFYEIFRAESADKEQFIREYLNLSD